MRQIVIFDIFHNVQVRPLYPSANLTPTASKIAAAG